MSSTPGSDIDELPADAHRSPASCPADASVLLPQPPAAPLPPSPVSHVRPRLGSTNSGARQVHAPTLQAALSPPAPTSTPLPGCKLFVDLFAGASAPLSSAVAELNLARLEPLDKLHGCAFDLLNEKHYQCLCALASSGIVGAASAAPPCGSFSRARLRPGGPKPVRTPEFPTGIPSPSAAQQAELDLSAQLHERTRHFLALVSAHGGLIILENPSSSILWLDPAVRSWLAVHAPYCVHVAACQYGLPLPKAWAFWSNFSVLSPVACKCSHPPGFHPSFAGRRSSDGSFATRQTACYPDKLAAAIAVLFCPSGLQQCLSRTGHPCYRPNSFGLCSLRELKTKTELEPAAQPSGVLPENRTSSSRCDHLGLAACNHQAFCPASLPISCRLARSPRCQTQP